MSPDGQYVSYEVNGNSKIINLENNEVFNPPGANYLEYKTLVSGSWINVSSGSSHNEGVLIYERLSDSGISVMSFTDRDGASPNLGEAVQWHFDNDRMSDVGNYVVINRNDYSSSVDIIDGYRSISNVPRNDWTWDVITQEFGTTISNQNNSDQSIDQLSNGRGLIWTWNDYEGLDYDGGDGDYIVFDYSEKIITEIKNLDGSEIHQGFDFDPVTGILSSNDIKIEAGSYYFIETTPSYDDIHINAFSVVVSPNDIDNTIYTDTDLTLTDGFVNAVFAGSSDVKFIGNQEDNNVIGNIGNNIIDGHDGNDTFVTQGNFDTSSSIYNSDGSVTLNSEGGTDELINIEFVQFDDGIKTINDVIGPLAPTSISLDNLSVDENSPGAHVGNISGSDPNNDDLIYSIVEGEGNAYMFMVINDKLYLETDVTAADYETSRELEVTIRATDQDDLYFDKLFIIDVIDDKSDNIHPQVVFDLSDSCFKSSYFTNDISVQYELDLNSNTFMSAFQEAAREALDEYNDWEYSGYSFMGSTPFTGESDYNYVVSSGNLRVSGRS